MYTVGDALVIQQSSFIYRRDGYTGKLQVLDVGINKPFKNYQKDGMIEWQLRNHGNNDARVGRDAIAEIISNIWKRISSETNP